jgi:hypothetical protein
MIRIAVTTIGGVMVGFEFTTLSHASGDYGSLIIDLFIIRIFLQYRKDEVDG